MLPPKKQKMYSKEKFLPFPLFPLKQIKRFSQSSQEFSPRKIST